MKRKRKNKQENRPALEWRESRSAGRQDELYATGQLVAVLRWEGLFSTLATGTATAGRWTFVRPKLLSRDVEVRVAGQDALFAVFSPGWTEDGTLSFAGGRALYWRATNFWRTEWVFDDGSGQALMRFEDTSGLFRKTASVGPIRSGLSDQDRALLVLLGRYLIVLQDRDRAAIVAAITPAIAG